LPDADNAVSAPKLIVPERPDTPLVVPTGCPVTTTIILVTE